MTGWWLMMQPFPSQVPELGDSHRMTSYPPLSTTFDIGSLKAVSAVSLSAVLFLIIGLIRLLFILATVLHDLVIRLHFFALLAFVIVQTLRKAENTSGCKRSRIRLAFRLLASSRVFLA